MNSMHEVKQFSKSTKPVASPTDHPHQNDELIDALNQCLAHAIDLRSRTKQAFWSAKGGSFYALHKMFDDFSSDLDSIADEFAARVMSLGGTPAWTPAVVAKTSKLPNYPSGLKVAEDHLKALLESYQTASRHVNPIIFTVAKMGDHPTASVIAGYSKLLDEQAAFIGSHMAQDWTGHNQRKAVS
jgi:starvation-inducible DNA-binding protein